MKMYLPFRGSSPPSVATCLLIVLGLSACGSPEDGQMQGPPPTPVNVAEVRYQSIALWDEFSGRIEAIEDIELQPRVSGYLKAVHFTEGSTVEAGDLLFTIDSREFQAAVDSAEANLARARSRLEIAETEHSRNQKLIDSKAISQEELERGRGELLQARADRQSAEAALARAQLDLQFTRITAPIDGVIGAAEIRPGNLVNAGITSLSRLVSVDPVYVTFEGDEQVFLDFLSGEADSTQRFSANPVQVGLANEEGYPHIGQLDFVDNRVDPNSGTIRARAMLSNPNGRFTPGLFARVRMLELETRPRLLIHEQAVLTDQDRRYVYVVDENQSAQRRDIELGENRDGLRLVERGLNEGDRVVVAGMSKIFFPGAPVSPTLVPMDQPNMAVPTDTATGE